MKCDIPICKCFHRIEEKTITAGGKVECVKGCGCKTYIPLTVSGIPVKRPPRPQNE